MRVGSSVPIKSNKIMIQNVTLRMAAKKKRVISLKIRIDQKYSRGGESSRESYNDNILIGNIRSQINLLRREARVEIDRGKLRWMYKSELDLYTSLSIETR